MPTPPNPRPADGAFAGGDPAADRPSAPPTASRSSSHYDLLELAPSASSTELRQSFRRLSKRYHPDTTSLPASEAEEAFRRLKLAYGVLSDPSSRRRYDALLLTAATLPAVPSASGPMTPRSPRPAESPQALGVRRALSGGEWFALLLLGVALVLSLVLGIGVAWARGAALVRSPSWWTDPSSPRARLAPPTETSGAGALAGAAAIETPPMQATASSPMAAAAPPPVQPPRP